ncbi:uncharacterized protein LOC142242537, partial [Haematobia irritans]|uniref:uncharacterized protein LOC142242537 n=1 Tax=Haematobia irritans TaxID=7368 RepID=UPI003F503256
MHKLENRCTEILPDSSPIEITSGFQTENVKQTLETIKKKVLMLTLQLYQENHMPRSRVLEIQNSVSMVLLPISNMIENRIIESEVTDDFRHVLNFLKDPFNYIKSEYRFLKTLKERQLYESPKTFQISNIISEMIVNGNPDLCAKSATIYIMPLKFMFESIFKIPKLLQQTLANTEQCLNSNGIYNNYASGQLFKEKVANSAFPLTVPYVLYLDDFQINNPLGSHTFSICGCYINFPTMPQHLLSKLEFIFPVAFIPTADLKKHGNEVSFHHLSQELKKLENGVEITVENKVYSIRFILGLIVGDNLALNSILGFVQSFHSKRYCRVCLRTKEEMKCDTTQFVQFLRNDTNYHEDLLKNNFQETGIKNVCIFEDIPSFRVTDNLCFDLMHDVYEG